MSPEFLRRYYVLKIISNPKAFGIDNDCYVTHLQLKNKLEDKQYQFNDTFLFKKFGSNCKKTINRDLQIIEKDFGVTINLKRNYGYYIKGGEILKSLNTVFSGVELLLINKKASQNNSCVTTENSSLNTKIDFLGLIDAIENKYTIHLSYIVGTMIIGLK